jgi:uncharacterized protein YjbJ (UPF0337 family)
MTIGSRIKKAVQGAKLSAQITKGMAKQMTGRAAGNDRLRREGRVDEARGKLKQFVKKVKDAIRR